ncbi:MAG: lipopolysaccharide kinase InaA family protein [Opitutales bacterium]
MKRYNPKPLGYRLKHAFSTSRAARSWANAHILRDVGIATAAPVAFVEERKYGLVSHAYYVMEYLEGKTLDVFLNDKEQPSEAITFAVNATARLFEIMLTNCLVHGDTKATNFILSQGSLYVVDLDALKLYRPSRVFERRFERDRSRFLSNWKNRPELKAAFSRALPTP